MAIAIAVILSLVLIWFYNRQKRFKMETEFREYICDKDVESRIAGNLKMTFPSELARNPSLFRLIAQASLQEIAVDFAQHCKDAQKFSGSVTSISISLLKLAKWDLIIQSSMITTISLILENHFGYGFDERRAVHREFNDELFESAISMIMKHSR